MRWTCAWDDGSTNGHSNKLNREHALGQQMGRLIDGPESFTVQRGRIAGGSGTSTSSEWMTSKPTEWVSKSFCEACNSGWMAEVDNDAKPALAALLDWTRLGTPAVLCPDQRDAIALWSYKLSLVFQHVAGDVRSDDDVFYDLYANKAVPEHAAVAAGVTSFTYATTGYGVHAQRLPFAADAVVPVFTLLLKHVVVRVVSSASGRPLTSSPEFSIPLRDPARALLHPVQQIAPLSWRPASFVASEEALLGLVMGQPYPT